MSTRFSSNTVARMFTIDPPAPAFLTPPRYSITDDDTGVESTRFRIVAAADGLSARFETLPGASDGPATYRIDGESDHGVEFSTGQVHIDSFTPEPGENTFEGTFGPEEVV